MILISIDPDIENTGLAVLHIQKEYITLLDLHAFNNHQRLLPDYLRCNAIAEAVKKQIIIWKPEVVLMEAYQSKRHKESERVIRTIQAIEQKLIPFDINIIEVSNSHWKEIWRKKFKDKFEGLEERLPVNDYSWNATRLGFTWLYEKFGISKIKIRLDMTQPVVEEVKIEENYEIY